jgi:hypothetical protein
LSSPVIHTHKTATNDDFKLRGRGCCEELVERAEKELARITAG